MVLAALLVLALLAAGCGKKKAGDGASSGPPAVQTARAEMGVLEGGAVITGKLEAVQQANIVPKVPGKVARVEVDVGSRVSAGQVLVALENKDLADRLNQAEAAVAQAEAGLTQAQAGLKAAQANLENARASLAVAEANYNRAKELLAAGAISQADFEGRYELPYKQARQQVEASSAQVEQAQAAVRVQEAALAGARANASLARTAYEDSFIRAPFSGVVTARYINPGEMAATAPVVSLANLDKVVVKATCGEKLINQLKVGQKVKVVVAAVRPEPFEGTITHIGPAAEAQTKAFPVKVEIDNPDHVLKPGMFAEVRIDTSSREQLLIPREALVRDGESTFVWVVKDGRVQRRAVTAGESDGKKVAILSGLEAGEEVVTAGYEGLAEGAEVRVKGE